MRKSKLLNISKKVKFLKKIYLFYNIYIRNYKFLKNGSQFQEDEFILNQFSKTYKGKYLDIGCYHPTRHNNTFKMYKLGWTGINIDLNPLTIELFDYARPLDINLCSAISNKRSTKKLYFLGDLDSKNTLDLKHKNWLSKHFKINNKDFKIKNIKTNTLCYLLKKYDFYKIDFMNLDIEGHELNVIKSIDFKKFDIKVICVEILNYDKFSNNKKKLLISYLKKNRYFLRCKSEINYIFEKKH